MNDDDGGSTMKKTIERQNRRYRVIMAHLTASPDLLSHEKTANSSNQQHNSMVPNEQTSNKSEENSLNLLPLTLISQLTSLTTKSLDIYRNALHKYLQNYEEEEDLNDKFDLQSWTYSLSRLSHNLSYLILSQQDSVNSVGIKNSSYMSSVSLSLCNLYLSLLLNKSVNKYVSDLINPNGTPSRELTLSTLGQAQFVLFNCLAHISSGILQRNASVIVENYSSVQQQRLMTAYYFILATGAKIWMAPVQSIVSERYGLSTTFLLTAIFALSCAPLFSTVDIDEFRGDQQKTTTSEQQKQKRRRKHDSNKSQSQQTSHQRLRNALKTTSYLFLLFTAYASKDILQAQSHATFQICGRMGGKRASIISSGIAISQIVLNRLLNLSSQLSTDPNEGETNQNFSILLLVQSASLALSILSKSPKIFTASFSVFSVALSLMHQHLIKEGLASSDNISSDTDNDNKLTGIISNLQMYGLPLLSTLTPTIFSLIRNKWMSKQKMSPLRLNLALLLALQASSGLFYKSLHLLK